jgi:hypothetical protein
MNRMDIRRRMLEAAANGVSFAYTGTFDSFGDGSQGFLVLKTSGTLTIAGTVDLCLVGGGGKGRTAVSTKGGGGGAGGFVQNFLDQELDGNLLVTIGAGSTTQGSAGEQTKVGTSYTANGGNSPTSSQVSVTGRGTSGMGASSGGAGTNGEDGVFPFDDSVNFSGYCVSGCGGGGAAAKPCGLGGTGGGGNGGNQSAGTPGAVNTGGGGGGGAHFYTYYVGGNGGSGVVFICWGYTH